TQYSRNPEWNDFLEIKLRGMHAFQTTLMLKALRPFASHKVTVVDIGDSSGTHMRYLKEVCRDRLQVDTISVNLDPRAVEKIKARGLEAILCRAEELDLPGLDIDLFTSFEMVEHLHNPALFFYRLAKRSSCRKILITVPYLRASRVGLHHVRARSPEKIFAEDEHIFELSPEDWTLLLLHSGWKISHSEVYYQYPRKWPIVSQLLGYSWKTRDYEGFWGAILEKDLTFANRYQDWEESLSG
ncbi:MAG: methyltransferase domain-containing protein, partial [Syntrophales bacterium]